MQKACPYAMVLSFKGFYTFPYHKFNTNNANHRTHHLQYFSFDAQ